MFVQIDPRVPLVWRDHNSAQAGIDPPRVRIDGIDDVTARALAELVRGTSTQKLTALLGQDASSRIRLQLQPVLGITPPRPLGCVAVIGRSDAVIPIAETIAPAFGTLIVAPQSHEVDISAVDLAILVSDFVVSPMDVQPWLGNDKAHLTVTFTESSALIGPLVKPGESACVSCVELERIDADPAWSAIAPQVWLRSAKPARSLITHAASEILSMYSAGAGFATRIDAETFERVTHPCSVHPQCGCQSLPALPG